MSRERPALLLAVSAALLLSGCGDPAPPRSDTAREPRPVAAAEDTAATVPRLEPDLSELEPQVREQILAARAAVAEARSAPARERAARLGHLGAVYQAYEFLDAALECHELAHELDPSDPRWPYLSGLLESVAGRTDRAMEHFRASLHADAEQVPASVRLANLLVERGRLEEAAPLVERVLARAPEAATSWELAGRFHARRGEDPKAVQAFERALQLDPEASSLNVPLGQALRRVGEEERAREVMARAGGRRPALVDPVMAEVNRLKESSAGRVSSALLAAERGELAKAEADLRRALELDPTSATARANLGVVLVRRGRPLAALPEFEEALVLDPDHVLARFNAGTVLSDLGRDQEAVPHHQRVLALDPTNQAAHYNLANSLTWLGRHGEALEHYARAVELDPSSPEPHWALVQSAVRVGDWKRALEWAEAGATAHPEERRLRLQLGRLLACSPSTELRDPERAAALAASLLAEVQDLSAVEVRAMALSTSGHVPEAAALQARAVQAAERLGAEERLPRLRHHLELYAGGRSCDRPWPPEDPIFHPRNPAAAAD